MQELFGVFAPNWFDRGVIAVTASLPTNWIGLRIAILLRRAVTMRLARDGAIDVERWGLRLRLHPRDNGCEKNLLFTPQLFEQVELRALARAISDARPATFIDIGANVGLWSLYAASVAPHARIVAIEPEPGNLERMRFNIQCNPGVRIRVAGVALGEASGRVAILPGVKDRGATTTVPANGQNQATVTCRSLLDVLRTEDIETIDALKIDVEGAEDTILVPFFRDAPQRLWPRLMIIEDAGANWRVDLLGSLRALGYVEWWRTRLNVVLGRLEQAEEILHPLKKVRPAPGGEPAAREPGLGTGRGGDVTGVA
jgi:FkbM family methyltransferase